MQTDHAVLRAENPRALFLASFYPILVRVLAGLLILTLCLWMLSGILRMLLGLAEIPSGNWTLLAEHAIIESLVILAQLELVRTLQAYLTLGRVRVTLILDTALVVLIGELMGLWFREYAPEKVLLSLAVIAALVLLRIVTTRFSPEPAA